MPADVRALIRELSTANPLWGAPRIHGELQKLGIVVSQSTVATTAPPAVEAEPVTVQGRIGLWPGGKARLMFPIVPDGALYLLTDNGQGRVLKLVLKR